MMRVRTSFCGPISRIDSRTRDEHVEHEEYEERGRTREHKSKRITVRTPRIEDIPAPVHEGNLRRHSIQDEPTLVKPIQPPRLVHRVNRTDKD
jgi:hypothetical protein